MLVSTAPTRGRMARPTFSRPRRLADDYAPGRSPIPALTGIDVEQLFRSRSVHCRYARVLPVRQQIIHKTAVLRWKCLHDAAPRYLADLCVPAHSVHGRQQLRSTASGTLLVRAPGLLPVSAASPSMDHEHGRVCQRNSEGKGKG